MSNFIKEKTLLFSGIAEQKRKYLNRCIIEAQKAEASGNQQTIAAAHKELRNAVALAVPAETFKVVGELPEAFTIYAGGRKSAEFSTVIETAPCDGILLSVEYDGRGDDAFLTVGLGTDDGVSYVSEIPLPQSGGKLWISYDLFCPALTGAERLVVALEADEDIEVRVIPESFFREVSEKDTRVAYTETPADELSNTKFYKIVDLESNRAFALTPRIREVDLRWEQSLIRTDKDQKFTLEARAHDYTQEWQLYKTEYGKYHIINKSNANHIQLDENGKPFPTMADMNCPSQDFDIYPAGHGKFSIVGFGGKPLVCENVKSGIWQVLECVYGEWIQTFADEFEGEELDRGIWGVYNAKIRPDTEPVYFLDRPENFYMEDGNLVIRTADDGYNGIPQTGAYMDSRGLYGLVYGKMEMNARVATGHSIWPAFWSMGIVGNWPYQGEIDVMELVGGGKELDSQLFGTLHWSHEDSKHLEKGHSYPAKDFENLNDRYHTYAAEWEYDHLRLYTDDMLYMALHLDSDGKKWGFGDNPHYLILNTSVRGKGGEVAYEETAKESFYYIDWVRCYKREGEVTPCDNLATEAKKPDYVNGVASEWLNKVCTSPDGKYVAATGQGGQVFVYGQNNDELLFTRNEPCVAVEAISFTPDSKFLVVPNRDGDIFLYDCADFAAEPVHINNIGTFHEFVAFTPDSKFLVSGGRDTIERGRPNAVESRALRCWSVNGELVAEVMTGSDVRNAAISADGKLVAAVCSDGTLRAYELDGLKEIYRFANETGAAMRGVDFSASGLIVCSDEAGFVYFCDIKKNKVTLAEKVNPSSVKRVRFSKDGKNVLAACADNCARIFDVATGKQAALLGGFTEMVSEAKYSLDGSMIAVSSYDGTVKIFDAAGAYISTLTTDNKLGRWIMDIAFSADGKRIFAAMGIKNTDYCAWNI